MSQILRLIGSLKIAVLLLIAIAAVLAWGTIYETRFGTAAVQRFIYTAWWFQTLLGFLAINLAMAAMQRFPWKRRQLPFMLAHLGIIFILVGGIIGGRFGIEGRLIIAEGQSQNSLILPGKVLAVHTPHGGAQNVFPASFETHAWVREPNAKFRVQLEGREITLTVDRYFSDAAVDEEITGDGEHEFPAVHLSLKHEARKDSVWLLARDPEQFGTGWGEAHVVFLELKTEDQVAQLTQTDIDEDARGIISVTLPGDKKIREIPVPEDISKKIKIKGTPYEILFKDYFPDFMISEQGIASRSDQPNNPAISFLLSGPEGTDPYLLFAFHPEADAMHGWNHTIDAQLTYAHPAHRALPPNAIALLTMPSGNLGAAISSSEGEIQIIDPLEVGVAYTHPWLGYEFAVNTYYSQARVSQDMVNASDEVRSEALHIIARENDESVETWLGSGQEVELALGKGPVIVEYRSGRLSLPFTVKLLDFRKITYPGSSMPAAFESDVELTDMERGIILIRTIEMNEPLKYRGYSLFQSSFIEEPVETTILSVRNDPGTPAVYAGFIVVMLGMTAMFMLRKKR